MAKTEEQRIKDISSAILAKMESCSNPRTMRDLTASYKNIQDVLAKMTAQPGGVDDPLLEVLARWDRAAEQQAIGGA